MDMALPMNSGAEAVETAIKAARKWGYEIKGVAEGKAEIIVCEDNFHGRTTTIVGFSTEPQYRDGFGPFTPGFRSSPTATPRRSRARSRRTPWPSWSSPSRARRASSSRPTGYLRRRASSATHRVLFVADEIQTGFGRTGQLFACEHEGVEPDMFVLGKALGGGFFPVSAVAANQEVLGVFTPGEHGSTFGGNPLACAVARAALDVLVDERLAERAAELGEYLVARLRDLETPTSRRSAARPAHRRRAPRGGRRRATSASAEGQGLLCKETHDHSSASRRRSSSPSANIDSAMEKIREVLG